MIPGIAHEPYLTPSLAFLKYRCQDGISPRKTAGKASRMQMTGELNIIVRRTTSPGSRSLNMFQRDCLSR
jgi:hypothetical protein